MVVGSLRMERDGEGCEWLKGGKEGWGELDWWRGGLGRGKEG
jgi:hypothetical protein